MNKKGISLIGLGLILILPVLFGSGEGYFFDSSFGLIIGILSISGGLYQYFLAGK